jgi:adenylyltransferase/sulfurtransferase
MSQTINLEDKFNLKYFSRELLYSWLSSARIKELSTKRVLIVGAGGLGSFSSTILLKSGVFNLTIMDFDKVDISNLHRQLYSINELGKKKAKITTKRLSSYFNKVNVKYIDKRLTEDNLDIIKEFDLIIDGTDSLYARYLINKGAILYNKPAIFAMIGNSKVMIYPKNVNDPCLSCFLNIGKESKKTDVTNNYEKNNFKDSNNQISGPTENNNPKDSNDETKAVIAPVNVLAASIQSYIAIKMLLGISNDFDGRLITFDFEEMKLRKIKVKKNKNCIIC